MTYDKPALGRAALFDGVDPADYDAVLACLSANIRRYGSGQAVLRAGERAGKVGIVLAGAVDIVRGDVFGNRAIVARMEPGDMFGEAYAFAGTAALPVSAVCAADSDVLLFDADRIAAPCADGCGFHAVLIQNMLGILAQKNILLNDKLDILSRRRMRDKILTYLWRQRQQAGSDEFEIPFNREQMADYLGADRSALSAELSRMRREGLIDFHKNIFKITPP